MILLIPLNGAVAVKMRAFQVGELLLPGALARCLVEGSHNLDLIHYLAY